MNFSIFSSRLSPRSWFRLAFLGVCLVVVGLIGVNVVIDPYDYFGLSPLADEVQTNERVWKTIYLETHHAEYNAFIMGSSIASQLDPTLAGELTGDSFYNLTMSGANTYDFRLLLEHMQRNEYSIKRLLLIFDLSVFWSYGESGREYERNHPWVSGDSPIEFYASYMTQIHFWGTVDKIRLSMGRISDPPHASYDRSTGVYEYTAKNRAIRDDHELFLTQSRTLNENFLLRTRRPAEPFLAGMEQMRLIQELCAAQGIELTVIVPPHNYNYMNRVEFMDYATYLRTLAGIVDYWNFSGYGEINLDNHHFFDSMHFRPYIGDRILRHVYGGGEQDIDFGRWVTRENVEQHLQVKRAEFDYADRTFLSYEEKKRGSIAASQTP